MEEEHRSPSPDGLSIAIVWRREEVPAVSIFYKRLPKFEYVKPRSLQEALSFLKNRGEGTIRPYAGGTDIIPQIKSRLIPAPDVLMDLKGIPDLDTVSYDEEAGLRIGALASIRDVADSPAVIEHYPALAEAASSIASTQVQNRGTIVGNVCNAVPSADSAPALLCLKARLVCAGSEGDREIDLQDFFTGPKTTLLAPDELVREIRVPPARGAGTYIKLSPRSRMDLAVVGVAVFVEADGGAFKEARIGLGAVAPTPLRAQKAESVLTGERVAEKVIQEAARKASEESSPIDDHRASAEYRRLMVEVLVKRALDRVVPN
jgi:carbon-monoxide dehydrogenase medium subunit